MQSYLLSTWKGSAATVLMVTHDLDTLFAICDRVDVLIDKHIPIAESLENVVKYDHPWVKEYFGGPRARAATDANVKAAQHRAENAG